MTAIREMYDLIKRLLSRGNIAHRHYLAPSYWSTKLLRGIEEGRFSDDESAELGLFAHESDQRKRAQHYRKTKYDLIDRLIKLHLFLSIRPGTHSEYKSNAYTAKRELMVAEVLQWFQCHEAMHILARRVFVKAQRYHLTYEYMRSAEILRNYHTIRGPVKECEYYITHAEKAFDTFQFELKASNIHARFRAELATAIAPSNDALKVMHEQSKWMEEALHKHPSRLLWQLYCDSVGFMYWCQGKYERSLQIHTAYRKFLEENQHLSSNIKIAQNNLDKLECYYRMGCFNKAEEIIEDSNGLFDYGSAWWFRQQVMHCIVYMHQKKWEQAAEIFSWVINQRGFKKDKIRVELWSVIEGYLRFFCDDESVLPQTVTIHGSRFNFHYLLQEIEAGRLDKAGMNIAILLLQALNFLKMHQFELFEGRVDAMRAYVYKYLAKDTSGRFNRTKLFFQLFNAIKRVQYDLNKVQKSSVKKHREMCAFSLPTETSGVQIEEIVPYEHIWERVLIELEKIEQEGHFVKEYRGAYQSAP